MARRRLTRVLAVAGDMNRVSATSVFETPRAGLQDFDSRVVRVSNPGGACGTPSAGRLANSSIRRRVTLGASRA